MTDWLNHIVRDKISDRAPNRETEKVQAKPDYEPAFRDCYNQFPAYLANLACQKLAEVFDGAFDEIDDHLFDMANTARSNTEQSELFDAMRELRLKRKKFEQFIDGSINKLFLNPFLDVQFNQSRNFSVDVLSLVEDEELETQVLIESTINSLRVNHLGEILQFQTRYSTLLSNSTPSNPANPIEPEKIANLIAKACSYLDLEQDNRLMVLKHFNKALCENYASIVETLNAELLSRGILPALKFKSGTDSKEPGTQGAAATSTDKEETVIAPTGADTGEQDILNEMKSLLSKLRSSMTTDETLHRNLVSPTYKQDELFDTLSNLQSTFVSSRLDSGKAEILDVKKAISQQASRSGTSSKSIAENDEDLINLVSMLFEFILDDYNLSAPIQVLISRLQIPILKVVLKDQTFFSKATHPARKLLNALAKAGIGWNEESALKKDQLFTQIQNIVRRIIDEFDGDIGLFQELYDEFQHFIERELKRSAIIEARTKEAEIGRIKSQRAQTAVKRVLKALLHGTDIPPAASEILQNGWSRVMFIAYLKDESENRWKESVHVAETLVWCLEPHTDSAERERWCRIVPLLLKKLKTGLTEISYNSANLNQKIEELKNALTNAYKNPTPIKRDHAAPGDNTRKIENQAADNHQSSQTDVLSPEDEKVLKLSVGDWIEFSLVNGSKFRCKLSTIIESADCYIFVNRLGLKVLEKTRKELANDLKEKKVAILQQGLMVDRALNAVIGNLRKMSDKRA
ncbi:MAG: hypothetical protein CSB48_09155 [Proteobacteria bacterium]|nr:MAG: hypothetical protein CSB48_09155 [Pseudomonadota bacterium]